MKNAKTFGQINSAASGQFVKTVGITGFDFSAVKPGQWVKTECGNRGQYLGTTFRGIQVVRWQGSRFDGSPAKFSRVDAKANKPMRKYAKVYGSR